MQKLYSTAILALLALKREPECISMHLPRVAAKVYRSNSDDAWPG